jgi:DNA-binding response OmpR family regulator
VDDGWETAEGTQQSETNLKENTIPLPANAGSPRQPSPVHRPPSTVEPVNRPPSTVLIVEDNSDLRQFLQYLLSDYSVLTAENGQAALALLESTEQQPDLIVSDLMMPVMDGFQLMEKLKSDDRWRHLPFLMLTAKVNARAKIKALRIGVDDYLTKPFQEDELKARIENLLRNYRERMEFFSTAISEKTNDEPTQTPTPVMSQADAEWLAGVEAYFEKRLGENNLSVNQAADAMHISPRQFQRRLKHLTGLTPRLYLQEMRLQKAKDYLLAGRFSTVKETAHATGFKNARYFSDLFQKHFASPPSSLLQEKKL